MDTNTITDLLRRELANPNTQKNFVTEKRELTVRMKGEAVVVEYDRTGIDPAQKREIEDRVVELLSGHFSDEQIFVKTNSKGAAPKASAQTSQKPAQQGPATIKAGHATPAPKRRVEGAKNVIAIGSGKGGVGKSTVTINLAATLVAQGKKVGVVDADIYGPSVPTLLGVKEERPGSNSDKKIVPLQAHGIHFMSFGLFIEERDPVIWRGPMLGGVLNQFLFDVAWPELDYLLIDLPPGTGDIQLSMVQNTKVDGAIIVSTPQDLSLLDAQKGLEMFRKLNIPILGLVENMSSFVCDGCGKEHFIFGSGGVANRAKELELELLGQIPLEAGLREASDEGEPFVLRNGGSIAAKTYLSMAEKLTPKKGLLSRILKR